MEGKIGFYHKYSQKEEPRFIECKIGQIVKVHIPEVRKTKNGIVSVAENPKYTFGKLIDIIDGVMVLDATGYNEQDNVDWYRAISSVKFTNNNDVEVFENERFQLYNTKYGNGLIDKIK